ncbi:MAG: MarR family transcriptional regulator [Myxococcaceae bacterium]
MRQTISEAGHRDVSRLLDALTAIGRRNCLRDPMTMLVEQAELSPAQVHALSWLRLDAPLTMGALAQRLGVTEKTITGVVDRLERAKYAQRERSSADRRIVEVVLTRQGQKLADQIQVEVERKLGTFLQHLDNQDRAALFRILENIAARLESAAHHSTAESNND